MTQIPGQGPVTGRELLDRLRADLTALDIELAEINSLVAQVKQEAARHEAKRAQAADRIGKAERPDGASDLADAYGALVVLTRKAAIMEAQAGIIESKRRSLARHRDAIASVADGGSPTTCSPHGSSLDSISISFE